MSSKAGTVHGTCRAPGCTIPATRCDLDHNTPWPTGLTTISNLNAKHRRHHNHKTRRRWRTTMDPDGTLTTTTMSDRSYTTRRHRYDDPHNTPATDQEHETAQNYPPPPF